MTSPWSVGPYELYDLNPPWLAEMRGPATSPTSLKCGATWPSLPRETWGSAGNCFDAVGGFDTTFVGHEDHELALRFYDAGHNAHHMPTAVVHYRYRSEARTLFRQGLHYGGSHPALMVAARPYGFAMPPRVEWRPWAWLVIPRRQASVHAKDDCNTYGCCRAGSVEFRGPFVNASCTSRTEPVPDNSYSAALVTFKRPESLAVVLDALVHQTHPPTLIVVADNDPDESARSIVSNADDTTVPISYVPVGANLGPAGGWAAAVEFAQNQSNRGSWIGIFDDDDPLDDPDVMRLLLEGAMDAVSTSDRVAAVGLRGARLSRRPNEASKSPCRRGFDRPGRLPSRQWCSHLPMGCNRAGRILRARAFFSVSRIWTKDFA